MSPEARQQQLDEARIKRIERGPDPRVDFARTDFESEVIWLLCFIAKKLNKPYLDVE